MEIIDPNVYYKLAERTPEERSVPMLSEIRLGQEYDITFEALKLHHQAIREAIAAQVGRPEIHRNPIGTLIQAVWLLWCYTSHDVSALRAENARLWNSIGELKSEIEALKAARTEPSGG